MPPSLVGGRAVEEVLPSLGRIAWGAHLLRVNCFLPGREGVQLPGNCPLPEKEVEQWPARRELSLFVGDYDLLLPEKEGEVLLGVLMPSPGGRGVPACLLGLLTTWGRLLLLLDNQVIFPSFLFTKFWNFLICLFLTLLNLVSPTLSMKPWYSLSLSVEMIDASWDLHCSSCIATLLRMLFMLLILAWIKSFSTFLIIFLALVVFKVDLSLRLTGTNSL